jgi:DNA-binding XRE family transcriptional regulator
MAKQTPKYPNEIKSRRELLGFGSSDVARLLGHSRSWLLSDFEKGRRLPTLSEAFKLSAVLREPVEFLFPQLYEKLRIHIRHQETKHPFRRRNPLQTLN